MLCHICQKEEAKWRCPQCGRMICPTCCIKGLCVQCAQPISTDDWKTKRLQSSVVAGESVVIVYHGGVQPGAKRRVTPKSITPHLVAHDHHANKELCFAIDKIEIVEGQSNAPDFVLGFSPSTRQLEYARSLGIRIPKGATKQQVSDLIDAKLGNLEPDDSDDLWSQQPRKTGAAELGCSVLIAMGLVLMALWGLIGR